MNLLLQTRNHFLPAEVVISVVLAIPVVVVEVTEPCDCGWRLWAPSSAKFLVADSIVGNMTRKCSGQRSSHCWAVEIEVVTLLRQLAFALVDVHASMALFATSATAACTEVFVITCTLSLESWTTFGRGCCCVVLPELSYV